MRSPAACLCATALIGLTACAAPPRHADSGLDTVAPVWPKTDAPKEEKTRLSVVPRSQWDRAAAPDYSDMDPMNGIGRVTVHHDGFQETFHATDYTATVARLKRIGELHRKRGWADVGYHYLIDRTGRIWAGRETAYQGAHVKDHNENNIGVCLLGNFNLQEPSAQQIEALERLLNHLQETHKVHDKMVFTHRELGVTECPGHHLQQELDALRHSRLLAPVSP